jgi:purine-nucleoside phosphorylase
LINNSNIILGLILGSGIDLYDEIVSDKTVFSIEMTGIHKKIIYSCSLKGKQILVFKGRKHFYEGYDKEDILANIHLAAEYGVKNLLITNAAGGLNENFTEGVLMLINSHVNFSSRFTYDKTINPYSADLQEKIKNAFIKSKVKLYEGCYGYYSGPAYETRAEIKMQKKIGIDAAGMSTIPEVYESVKLGINTAALSVITNLLKENNTISATHESIIHTAQKASKKLNKALINLINELN